MTLLETYANNVGVKTPETPVKPFAKYFPTPEKYITLHASSGMSSKNYSHYEQVITLLKPILDEHGISIIQIGTKEDIIIPGTRAYCGITDFHQTSFVVKNALLHIGNDSVWNHVAGQYNVPVVGLYGPTYSAVCRPFYKHLRTILIDSHRNGKIPSHAAEETPKTIDMINPEDVAQAALKVLDIDEPLNFKTLFIGERYYGEQLQLIPENINYPTFNKPIMVRMDLIHNELGLAKILTMNSVEIKTNKPLSQQIINGFRGKIKSIIYEVNSVEECDVGFLDFLNKGVRYILTSKLEGEELGKLKLKTFDYAVVTEEKRFEK